MNGDTLLHRQISPSWVQAGRVTRQAFKPFAKDEGQLSVYDGDMMSAEEAWIHYTEDLSFVSIGVLAVACRECSALELPVQPDPEPFPAHVLIDFRRYSNSQVEKKSKRLTLAAIERGWQFETDGTP